jgi:GNAT superfamily N-acetyltransferase
MITFHVDKLEENLPYLADLLQDHYQELALNKEFVPLDPQYEVYLQREKQGELVFITCRELGKIVGYYIGFVSPGLHYQTCLTCITDIFYIAKQFRGSSIGLRLFKFVEKVLIGRGVQRWFMGSKLHSDASPLFERIGAKPVEIYYSKWIGENSNEQ